MNRNEVVQLLNSLTRDYAQFGIKSMSLFGSMARDEATLDSDIDILVEFIDMPTFDNYMNLKLYLEDLFGRKVDLVEKETLHPSLRSTVESEGVAVLARAKGCELSNPKGELIEIAALPTVSRRHIRK